MDKAYTLIFALDGMGLIPGNEMTDYSSPETIMDSLLLPDPDPSINCIILVGQLKDGQFDLTTALNQFYIKELSVLDLFKIIHKNKQNGYTEFVYKVENTEELESPLVKKINLILTKINQYNASFQPDDSNYDKNRVMAAIRFASQDLRNLQASEVPMAAGYVNDRIDSSVGRLGDAKGTVYYNEDPTHIINFQFQAAIGKTGVGVSANAIKATGSIQQRANIQHLSSNTPFDFSIDLTFPIQQNDGKKYTINEKLRHVPNSILTELQLWNMYQSAITEDHPFNLLFTGEQTIPNSDKEKRFVEAHQKLKELGLENITMSNVLYQMYKDEENTADMISIFISLCTDNAKELQLYRIAGTPELLNIPLSLISIGVPVQDVTDICVLYLIPVLDRLNIGLDDDEVSVEKIISNLADPKNSSPLQQGYQSLLTVLQVGKEMRLLTKYFKINQGTSVKYAEVLDFLDSMQRVMVELALLKDDGTLLTFRDLLKDTPEALKYREECISKYNKTAFNLFDIIFNSAHYLAQLQAVDKMVDLIQDNIAVAKVTSEVYSTVKDPTDNKVTSTKITQIVQNVCFGNALQTMKDIAFDKESTIAKFGNWDPAIPNDIFVGVSTQALIDAFIQFVEKGVIPYLKTHYPDNYFVLTFEFDSYSGHYALPFASYEAKADLRIKQNINKTISAITKFSSSDSGLKTLYGTPITIGDLLTMYANIINLNRTNTLSAVLFSGTLEPSDLNYMNRVNQYYTDIDVATGIAYSNTSDLSEEDRILQQQAKAKIDALIEQATHYAKAYIDPESRTTVKINDRLVTFTVDTENKSALFSMVPGQVTTTLGIPVSSNEEIAQLLTTMLIATDSGCTLETALITPKGLVFSINVPHKTGASNKMRTFIYKDITSDTSIITQTQLSGLTDFLRANVQSIYQSINDLFVNQHGVYIKSTIKGTVAWDTIQQAALNDTYQDDKVLAALKEWGKSVEQDIVIIDGGDYVKSHIERVGNENILILTKADFNPSIPLKNRLFTLINLMCDSLQTKGMPSENSRFKTLIQTLDPSIQGLLHNLTFALRQTKVRDLISANPLMNFYYSNVVESQTESDVKRQALATISDYSRALLHRQFYFYEPNANVKNFLNGDIFYDASDDSEYMLVGQDAEGHLIMVSISPENLGKVKLHFRMSSDKNLTLKQRVKIHSNKSLVTETVKSFDVRNVINAKPETLSLLIIGSSVEIKGQWYSLVDILAVPAKQSYNTEYLLVDKDGKYISINSTSGITKFVVPNVELIPGSQTLVLEDATKISNQMKYRILKSLGFGTKATIGEGNALQEIIIREVNADHIVTTKYETYPLSEISSITYSAQTALILDPLLVYTYLENKHRTFLDYATLPEFNKGVSLKKTVTPQGVVDEVKPLYHLSIDPNVVKVSKNYNDIEVGDYIMHDAGAYYYHVLDIMTIEQKAADGTMKQIQYALCSVFGKSATESTPSPKIQIVQLNKLKSIPNTSLYKRNDNISRCNIQTKSMNAELTDEEKVDILLKRLATTFGTSVRFIENIENPEFAFIEDGTVVINLSRKPVDLSKIDYILSKGIHEFTHLALVALRAQNPDLYAKLIASIQSVSGFSTTGHYNTKVKQIEEYLVNKITQGISGTELFDLDILKIIQQELYKLLTGDNMPGITVKSLNSETDENKGQFHRQLIKTVGEALSNIDNYSMDNRSFTITELRAKAISEDILEKIEYECN